MSTSLAREHSQGRAGLKETALSKFTLLPHGLATAACGERLPGGLTWGIMLSARGFAPKNWSIKLVLKPSWSCICFSSGELPRDLGSVNPSLAFHGRHPWNKGNKASTTPSSCWSITQPGAESGLGSLQRGLWDQRGTNPRQGWASESLEIFLP